MLDAPAEHLEMIYRRADRSSRPSCIREGLLDLLWEPIYGLPEILSVK
jgi:hypothetical protein